MENDGAQDKSNPDDLTGLVTNTAINSVVLEYYKKFGRKRDLEQFFSLSTAHSDIRDPASLFWRRMKSQNDSSDSGEKKSESSTELCRISIKCKVPEPNGSQEEDGKGRGGVASPPIITEDVLASASQQSDNESIKSEDEQSQKSADATFDTSINKAVSPTSSVTSQRKLEWDSLADVGYGHDSDRKTSASSLSTLERLALKQQISNNESHSETKIGQPTAHSTPVEENASKKNKKDSTRKVTKIHEKDVDFVEVSVPHTSQSQSQPINVNLTKHISFNMEKDGAITVDNIKNNVQVTPEKVTVETEITPLLMQDKAIQTTPKSAEKSCSSSEPSNLFNKKYTPILINLNNLRRRNRQRKVKTPKKVVNRKTNKESNKENNSVLEKSGEQVSDAESFEYLPGHIYNQNKLEQNRSSNTAGNKSSLESSGAFTTDSSKRSKSFTRDLEKSLDYLKLVVDQRGADSELKKRLIKEVVQRLVKSRYKDDESTTDFLSGLSFGSRKLGLRDSNYTTTSTSDNTADKPKSARPKKSILRTDKFDTVATTSQSVPNLTSVYTGDQSVSSKFVKPLTTSHTESDASSQEKSSTDAFAKTSSEELYRKYIDALRREEFYKKYLREKEAFTKQKLVCSENSLQIPVPMSEKSKSRLKDLIADLTRNNYNDGSGDASKLESGVNTNPGYGRFFSNVRKPRSHSVFTLSSGTSDYCHKNTNKNIVHDQPKAGPSAKTPQHYCCCPYHSDCRKLCMSDSSVQVDIRCQCGGNQSPRHSENTKADMNREDVQGNKRYVRVSNKDEEASNDILVYKCSPLSNLQMEEAAMKRSDVHVQCPCIYISNEEAAKTTEIKSSQTELGSKLFQQGPCSNSDDVVDDKVKGEQKVLLSEAVRCIQTEITINPKISDPSLTDVKKMDDADCAKLVKEYQREVYKSRSQSDATSVAKTIIMNEQKWSNDKNAPDVNIKDLPYTPIHIQSTGTEIFKIPIEGANMTLFVNVGGAKDNKATPLKSNIDEKDKPTYIMESKQKCAATVTEKPKRDEKFTCINEECSKGVQCRTDDVFDMMESKQKCSSTVTEKPKRVEKFTCVNEECSKDVQCRTDAVFTKLMSSETESRLCCDSQVRRVEAVQFGKSYEVRSLNASPRKKNVDDKKPFLRSNTDNGCFSCFQNFTKNDVDYSENQPKSFDVEESIKIESMLQNPDDGNIFSELTQNISPYASEIRQNKMQPKESCMISCQTDSSKSDSPILGSTEDVMTADNNKKSAESSKDSFKSVACKPNTQKYTKVESKDKDCGAEVRFKHDSYPKASEGKRTITRSNTAEQLSFEPQKSKEDTETDKILNYSTTSWKEDLKCSGINKQVLDSNKKGNRSSTYPKTETKSLLRTNKEPTALSIISSGKTVKDEPKAVSTDPSKENQSTISAQSKNTCGTCGTLSNDENQDKSDDPILNIIQDITRRYSKCNIEKDKKKKCFKEIVNLLTCLLDTDESSERENAGWKKSSESTDCGCDTRSKKEQNQTEDADCCSSKKNKQDKVEPKRLVDKGIQLSTKRKSKKNCCTESSDIAPSTDLPGTSSDSATCNILKKIKRECEKYHQRRCKCTQKCATSSSTSVNCEQCNRVHQCYCRPPKCKGFRTKSCSDKFKKRFVAYNLIIQTSDSMISEKPVCERPCKPLQEVVVKVPPKKPQYEKVTFKEMSAKIEKEIPPCSSRCGRSHRPRACHNESDVSCEDYRRTTQYTVRDYLEQNRPDFVENASKRQNCLKMVSESRAFERATKRQLLSVQLEQLSSSLDPDQLRRLVAELSVHRKRKKNAPKIISEREMKRHSEKIYNSLPEVIRKQEELKKESIKRTNLLMASIFKRNLQKKTLRGAVNLSNYSQVIKI